MIEELLMFDDLTPDQVQAGSHQIATHAERQAYIQGSRIGEIMGITKCSIKTLDGRVIDLPTPASVVIEPGNPAT